MSLTKMRVWKRLRSWRVECPTCGLLDAATGEPLVGDPYDHGSQQAATRHVYEHLRRAHPFAHALYRGITQARTVR